MIAIALAKPARMSNRPVSASVICPSAAQPQIWRRARAHDSKSAYCGQMNKGTSAGCKQPIISDAVASLSAPGQLRSCPLMVCRG